MVQVIAAQAGRTGFSSLPHARNAPMHRVVAARVRRAGYSSLPRAWKARRHRVIVAHGLWTGRSSLPRLRNARMDHGSGKCWDLRLGCWSYWMDGAAAAMEVMAIAKSAGLCRARGWLWICLNFPFPNALGIGQWFFLFVIKWWDGRIPSFNWYMIKTKLFINSSHGTLHCFSLCYRNPCIDSACATHVSQRWFPNLQILHNSLLVQLAPCTPRNIDSRTCRYCNRSFTIVIFSK